MGVSGSGIQGERWREHRNAGMGPRGLTKKCGDGRRPPGISAGSVTEHEVLHSVEKGVLYHSEWRRCGRGGGTARRDRRPHVNARAVVFMAAVFASCLINIPLSCIIMCIRFSYVTAECFDSRC